MSMFTSYLQGLWPVSYLYSDPRPELFQPQPEPSEPRRRPILVHKGHTDSVSSIAFSPDGRSIISGSRDKTIRTWDAHTPYQIRNPLTGHSDPIGSVSYSPQGSLVASGAGRVIRLWDASTGRQVSRPLIGHELGEGITSIAFGPSGGLIASASTDRTIWLWDVHRAVADAAPYYVGPLQAHTGWVNSVAFSPDGTKVVSGSSDCSILVWDVAHLTAVVGPLEALMWAVNSVAFSPDGSQIISGSADSLRLWDARGRTSSRVLEGHSSAVNSVAFSPDGVYVASGAEDGTVRLWDVRTCRQVDEPFEHIGSVYSVAFSPCGRHIASGSGRLADNIVRVWSLSGDDSDVEHGPDAMIEDDTEQSEFESSTEIIDKHMTIQDMFDLLSHHGCVDLASEMDVNQDAAVVVNGGGFGDIWKGNLHDGTKVAIKAWRGSLIEQCDYKLLKRATREIHYWSKMKHDNVHQLMGMVMFKGRSLGMVSEWMENGNLHQYLRQSPSANRPELSVQVASGLAYIHSHDMVHGDIKGVSDMHTPKCVNESLLAISQLNVLISSNGVAKLTDFGLSTMSESSLEFSATTSPQAGSIRWAAPELLSEESAKSKESDVYALGMTILEIFTGVVPYSHIQRDYLIVHMVAQGTLPTRPMSQIKDDSLGNRVWNLLASCWGRQPDTRPPAAQVVESLLSISTPET